MRVSHFEEGLLFEFLTLGRALFRVLPIGKVSASSAVTYSPKTYAWSICFWLFLPPPRKSLFFVHVIPPTTVTNFLLCEFLRLLAPFFFVPFFYSSLAKMVRCEHMLCLSFTGRVLVSPERDFNRSKWLSTRMYVSPNQTCLPCMLRWRLIPAPRTSDFLR